MGQKKWRVVLYDADPVCVFSHAFEVTDNGALAFYDLMNKEISYTRAYGAGTWYSCQED